MTFIQGTISFVRELLTFYIPVFFTFRYLMVNDSEKVRAILKFWCILTIYYVLHHVLQLVIQGYLNIVLDIGVLVALNYNDFTYSQMIYDQFVGPFFKNNQQVIQKYSKMIQKAFDNNTQKLKSKVATSAGDKIKGFMGQVLVGVLNPVQGNSKKQMKQEKKEVQSDGSGDQEKDD